MNTQSAVIAVKNAAFAVVINPYMVVTFALPTFGNYF